MLAKVLSKYLVSLQDDGAEEPLGDDEEGKKKKNKKPLTKVAAAKKALKKRVVPNTKLVFDEEGEVRFLLLDFRAVARQGRNCCCENQTRGRGSHSLPSVSQAGSWASC